MTLCEAEEARAHRMVLVVVVVSGPVRVQLKAGFDTVANAPHCCHLGLDWRFLLALGYQIPKQLPRQEFLLPLKGRGL
jgi:hypothetical protein